MEPFLLLVLLVLGACGYWWNRDREAKLLAGVAELYGLELAERGLRGPELSIDLVTENSGKSRQDYIDYRLRVENAPVNLSLWLEGAASGQVFAQGQHEVVTGDVDFDDFFWIQSQSPQATLEYLTNDRRTLLLEAFWVLGDARLELRSLSGRTTYTEAKLRAVAAQLTRLARDLDKPAAPLDRKPAGWVNRAQRHRHAASALGMGPLLFLVAGCGLRALSEGPPDHLSLGVLLAAVVVVVLSLGFLATGVGLWWGQPWSGPGLRRVLKGVQGALILGTVAATVVAGFFGLMGGLLTCGLVGYGAECWRNELLRLRLGPPEPRTRLAPEPEGALPPADSAEWTSAG